MSQAWGRLMYESWDNEKVEELGNRAWGVFLRAVAWSGAKRKDGFITASAMRKIEADQRVWDRLEEKHMLERRTSEGAWLHDWSDHNETNARRLEREESYSRRGKAGAEAKHRGGSKQTPSNDGEQPEVERSRSDKRREDQTREDEDRASAPSAVIAQRSDDPYGIAPPGENPDAYPGSVEPLTLSPPMPSGPKSRSKKTPPAPRADLDPTTLSPEVHAAYVVLRDDPTLGPITARPAEAARDLAASFPKHDLGPAITEIAGRMRELDKTHYKNGPAALRNWLPNSRCFKPPTRPAPSSPAAPAPSTYRRPVGDGDPVDEQIAYFVRRGWQIPPPLLKLQAEERAKEAAAKEAAAAADAPPVVGPRTTPLRDDEETPF